MGLVILLGVLGLAWTGWTRENNVFLSMSYDFALHSNTSACWVCTQVPHTSGAGIQLLPIPFNITEVLAAYCFHNDIRGSGCLRTSQYHKGPNNTRVYVPGPIEGNNSIFAGWYIPPFGPGWMVNETRVWKIPRLKLAIQPNQTVNATCHCRTEGSGVFLGSSTCTTTWYTGPSWPLNGTYYVCGSWAYPWLPGMPPRDDQRWERLKGPTHWRGCCYLAYIVPHMRSIQHLADIYTPPRSKRGISESERFWMIAFPLYGTARLSCELINVASVMERLANATAEAFADTREALTSLTAEVVALRTVALQNRMALDFILAEKGGTCALVGSECCTYIPDESSNITNLAAHISQEVTKIKQVGEEMNYYHDETGPWAVWPFSIFRNLWGTVVHYGLIGLLIVASLYMVKCIRLFCASRRI